MNVELLRVAVLTTHAAAGLVALGAGVCALRTGRGAPVLMGGVTAMTLLLVPSMALGWREFGPVEKVVFPGLGVLACFMVAQARAAQRELAARGLTPAAVDHAGFCVIALTVAGTIVPLLRLGPVATVIGTGAAFLAVRSWVMRRSDQVHAHGASATTVSAHGGR